MSKSKILLTILFVIAFIAYGWMNISQDKAVRHQPAKAGADTGKCVFTESFEAGEKASYLSGKVKLGSGTWLFDNALIGSLSSDTKNGKQSARLKNGSLTSCFDMINLRSVKFSYALFGNDKASSLKVLISDDGGQSFQPLVSSIPVSSSAFKVYQLKIEGHVKSRIKIENSTGQRINIDDIIWNCDSVISSKTNEADSLAERPASTLPKRSSSAGKDAPPSEGENSNIYLGNISNASSTQPDNFLLDQAYYVASYNRSKAIPNWVSWHLDRSNISGLSGRKNNFAADISLPKGWYQVQGNSYSGSGFDRGHNCPSGDRTSSPRANSSTFLMTNMIPQAPENNQKVWADFEVFIRKEVEKGNEAYVIMGVYGSGGYGTKAKRVNSIDNGKIAVPAHIWKVAVILPEGEDDLTRITKEAKIIAIDTPNENVLRHDWKVYLTTVDDIEKTTGYDLLKSLPDAFQLEAESVKFWFVP